MNRRNFITTTGLALGYCLIRDTAFAAPGQHSIQLIGYPDEVTAIINDQWVQLSGSAKESWRYNDVMVRLANTRTGITVSVTAPNVRISSVSLIWKTADKSTSSVLNDNWERTYGDASWHPPRATEKLPWYFMEHSGNATYGFGVKTGTHSFCSWEITPGQLSLIIDTRSGGNGVSLGDRVLPAAEIVTIKNETGETVFSTAKRFMKIMCSKARMPKEPVYGINDWYFSYGNTSEKLILEHTGLMAPLADGINNRPFSVIDAGWFKGPPTSPDDCCWGDNMDTPDEKFGDMGKLAEQIKKIGMRPGIWTRPLCGSYKDPGNIMLPMIKGREENRPVLDPSMPENLERITNYFKRYNEWGYELVKFDYTSFDIFGKWGFEMLKDDAITAENWNMHDQSRTNAEIILQLYQTIRKAAGDTYIIGCNTFSHLSAGLFELNRIGDDTSGNEWARTKKMGVNTLAFRAIHHGAFYAADSDCVGLTNKVP
jgi:alpha-galactosidase